MSSMKAKQHGSPCAMSDMSLENVGELQHPSSRDGECTNL